MYTVETYLCDVMMLAFGDYIAIEFYKLVFCNND